MSFNLYSNRIQEKKKYDLRVDNLLAKIKLMSSMIVSMELLIATNFILLS